MAERISTCSICGKVFPSGIRGRVAKTCKDCKEVRFHRWIDSKRWYILGALRKYNYKCAKCGATKKLHVHHLDGNGTTKPYEEQNNNIDNLIVLCCKCHRIEHGASGCTDNDIKEMREHGMTFQAIADISGVSRQAIHKRWIKFNSF
jgi:hypothetical protein